MPVDGNGIYPPDSIIVRFTFHSDASPNTKDGWMIDNILIGFRDEGSGIEAQEKKDFLRIVPNPLADKSRVVTAIPGINFDFTIYDLYGRGVYSRKSQSNDPIILNRENFIPGIYFWKAELAGKKSQTGKLVVY